MSGSLAKFSARRPSLPVGISPARGEIARGAAFANSQNWRLAAGRDTSISPLAGEMPTGRGGRLNVSLDHCALAKTHYMRPCTIRNNP
jgi:hypothetical protein